MTEKLSLGEKRDESPGFCLRIASDTMMDRRVGFVLAFDLRYTY